MVELANNCCGFFSLAQGVTIVAALDLVCHWREALWKEASAMVIGLVLLVAVIIGAVFLFKSEFDMECPVHELLDLEIANHEEECVEQVLLCNTEAED